MSSELQSINIKSRSIDFNSLTGINFNSGTGISYGSEFSKQIIDVNNVRIKGTLDLSDLVLSGNINTQFISSIFDINQDSMLDYETSKSTSDQYGATFGVTYGDNLGSINATGALNGTNNGGYVGPTFIENDLNEYSDILSMKYLSSNTNASVPEISLNGSELLKNINTKSYNINSTDDIKKGRQTLLNDPAFLIKNDSYFGNLYTLTNNGNPILNENYTNPNIIFANIIYDENYYVKIPNLQIYNNTDYSTINLIANCSLYNKTKKNIYKFVINGKIDDDNIDFSDISFIVINGIVSRDSINVGNLLFTNANYKEFPNINNNLDANIDINIELFKEQYNFTGNVISNLLLKKNYILWDVPNILSSKDVIIEFPNSREGYDFTGFTGNTGIVYFNNNNMINSKDYYNSLTSPLFGNLIEDIYINKMSIYNLNFNGNIIYVDNTNKDNLLGNINNVNNKLYIDFPKIENIELGDILNFEVVYENYNFNNPPYGNINVNATRFTYKNIDTWVRYKNLESFNYNYTDYKGTNNFELINYNGLNNQNIIDKAWYISNYTETNFCLVSGDINNNNSFETGQFDEAGLNNYEATYLFMGPFSTIDPSSSIFSLDHNISFKYKGGSEQGYDFLTLAYYDFKYASSNCIFAFDVNTAITNIIHITRIDANSTTINNDIWTFKDFNYDTYPNCYVIRNNMLMNIEGIYLYTYQNEVFVMNNSKKWNVWNEVTSMWSIVEKPLQWTPETNSNNIYALKFKTDNNLIDGYKFDTNTVNIYACKISNIDITKNTNYFGVAFHANITNIYYYLDEIGNWHLLSDNTIVDKPISIDDIKSSYDVKKMLIDTLNPKPNSTGYDVYYSVNPLFSQSTIKYVAHISVANTTEWIEQQAIINGISTGYNRLYVFFYMKDEIFSYIPDAYYISDILFTTINTEPTKVFERGWHIIENVEQNIPNISAIVAGYVDPNLLLSIDSKPLAESFTTEMNNLWNYDIIHNRMKKGDKTYFVIGPLSPITDFKKNILNYIYFEFEYSHLGIRDKSILNVYKVEKELHNLNATTIEPVVVTDNYIKTNILPYLESPFFQINNEKTYITDPLNFTKYTANVPVFNNINEYKVVFYVFEFSLNVDIPIWSIDSNFFSLPLSIVYIRNIRFLQKPIENDVIAHDKKLLPIYNISSINYKNTSKYFPNLNLSYQFTSNNIAYKLKNNNSVSITGNIINEKDSYVRLLLSNISSNINGSSVKNLVGNIIFRTGNISISKNEIIKSPVDDINFMNMTVQNILSSGTCNYYNSNFYKYAWHADNSLYDIPYLNQYSNYNNQIFEYPFFSVKNNSAVLVAGSINTLVDNNYIETPIFKKQICFINFSFDTLNDTRSFIIGFNYQIFTQRKGDFFYFQYSNDGGKTFTDLIKQSGNINSIRSVNDDPNIAWKNVSYFLPSGYFYTFRWVFYKITDFSQYYNTVTMNNLYVRYLTKVYDNITHNLKVKSIDSAYINSTTIMGTKNINPDFFDYFIEFPMVAFSSYVDTLYSNNESSIELVKYSEMTQKKRGFIDNLIITPLTFDVMNNYSFISRGYNPYTTYLYQKMNSYYYNYNTNINNALKVLDNINLEIAKKCWRVLNRISLLKYKFYDKSFNIPMNINTALVIGSYNTPYLLDDNWGGYLLFGPFDINNNQTNNIMLYDINISFDYFGHSDVKDHLVLAVIDISSNISSINEENLRIDIIQTLSSSSVINNNAIFYRKEYEFNIKTCIELNSETIWAKANNGYGVAIDKINKANIKYRYFCFYYIKNKSISNGIDSWAIANINISITTPGINKNTYQFLNFQDIITRVPDGLNTFTNKKLGYLNLIKDEKEFIRIPYESFNPEELQILYVTNNMLERYEIERQFGELYISPSYNQNYIYRLLNTEWIDSTDNSAHTIEGHWEIDNTSLIFNYQVLSYYNTPAQQEFYNKFIGGFIREYRLTISYMNTNILINPNKESSYPRYIYIFINNTPTQGLFSPATIIDIDQNVVKQKTIIDYTSIDLPKIRAIFVNNIPPQEFISVPLVLTFLEDPIYDVTDQTTRVKYIVSSQSKIIETDIQSLNKIGINKYITDDIKNNTVDFNNFTFIEQLNNFEIFTVDKIIQKEFSTTIPNNQEGPPTFEFKWIDSYYYRYIFRLYGVSPEDYQLIESDKRTPILNGFNNINKETTDTPFIINPPQSNSNGAFTYTSSNLNVATIEMITDPNQITFPPLQEGRVTIVSAGTTTITATQAADGNFDIGAITAVLTVLEPT